eukprot:CAMPEP_0117441890 /NCGR_PEP_ID=MMETSP0759-20121206/3867_1 /TAXON_ID=63605 /ORGANISM="Percolomonas cosmopolitus, Strain WS" /LENGTH=821 /DNA_ID=CAMNT_0005233757 /DNA_START=726 /DNA_END=3191 /DNA_ORIENTATION=-
MRVNRRMEGNVFVNGGATVSSAGKKRRNESEGLHSDTLYESMSASYLSVLEETYEKSVSSVHEIQITHAEIMELETDAFEEENRRGVTEGSQRRSAQSCVSLQQIQHQHPQVTHYRIIDLQHVNVPQVNLFGRFSAAERCGDVSCMIHVAQLNSNRQFLQHHPSLTIQRTKNLHSLLSTGSSSICANSAKVARIFYFIPKKQSFDRCIPSLKKLAFGVELLQLFFFYTLRHCFALETARHQDLQKQKKSRLFHSSERFSALCPSASVEIHIIRCSKTKKELNDLGNQWNIQNEADLADIFSYFRDMREEYDRLYEHNADSDCAVNLMFLGMTRLSKSLKKNIAHLYSQQGNCALLSSFALDLWPSCAEDIEACFTNPALLNPRKTIVDVVQHSASQHDIPAWNNITTSFARTIQTIAASFNVAQYLAPLRTAEGAVPSRDNHTNLMIHQVNRFFTSSLTSTNVTAKNTHPTKDLIFWNEGASKALRKSISIPLDSDSARFSPSDNDSQSTQSSQNCGIQHNKENQDPSLPTIRSRSVLSAVREEADSNLSAISNLPRIPSRRSGHLQMSSSVQSASSGHLPPSLSHRSEPRQSTGTKSSSDSHSREQSSSKQVPAVPEPHSKAIISTTSHWEYDSGYFKQISTKKWREYNRNESRHHSSYDQINMTQTYVLLYNPAKSMYMCLDGEQCRFSRDGEHFQLLHLGTFKEVSEPTSLNHTGKTKKRKRNGKTSTLGDKWRSKDDKSIYFQKNASENGEGEWIEYRNHMVFSTYYEEERTNEHVIMRDRDSGMIVKLMDGESFWRYEPSAGWEALAKGRFKRGVR